MTTPVAYADIPQTMRDLLDDVYAKAGVESWWNARQKPFDGRTAAEEWLSVEGRERVQRWVEYLTGGAW
jgi:hypothetical protein